MQNTAQAVPETRLRWGRALDAAAWTVLAAMPLALCFAIRSSAALIAVAAALALAGAVVSGRGPQVAARARAAFTGMPGALAALFAALAAASLLWHPFPRLGLFAIGEGFIPFLAAIVLGLALGPLDRPAMFRLCAALFALAAIEVSVELWTGLAWRHAIGSRTALFVLNKPAICLVVLYWPLLALAEGMARRALVMGALAALMAAAVFKSVSGASMVAFVAAALTFVLASRLPRLAWALVMAGLFAGLALAPVKGVLAERFIPDHVLDRLERVHARERVVIWGDFGAVVKVSPLSGEGFGVSPRMAETPAAARVPQSRRTLLAVGHPHDMFLQLWVELGAAGVLLAAAALGWLAWATRRLPAPRMAPVLACLAAVTVFAEVGHGAWQGWWVAILGAAAIWFVRVFAAPEGGAPGAACERPARGR
ncbi:O-antigen ligase family protein [Camelimonas abortus]|uniref:O-antigen ligase family protein n=1 Tax=Camelimonas abortus TaxID=1017184 RepID=A0ABV7LFC6_9HYPH